MAYEKLEAWMKTLYELRARIDEIDRRLITLLAERADSVRAIGELKTSEDEIIAADRQQEVYRTRRLWASEVGLDPDFVEDLYEMMIQHFISQERQQLAERNNHRE
jgi:chorismate mutase-like protein